MAEVGCRDAIVHQRVEHSIFTDAGLLRVEAINHARASVTKSNVLVGVVLGERIRAPPRHSIAYCEIFLLDDSRIVAPRTSRRPIGQILQALRRMVALWPSIGHRNSHYSTNSIMFTLVNRHGVG